MSITVHQRVIPIEIAAAPGFEGDDSRGRGSVKATARVCAIIVTWNRKGYVTAVLEALSRQTYPLGLLDVVVIDNAGTDGTLDHLCSAFCPERVIDNPTERAHEPRFAARPPATVPNRLGLSSLTVVRNASNMGGCGGFNTGLAVVDQVLGAPGGPAAGLDYVWLVDDDIDLPPDALQQLTRAMESDPRIGVVGSRTCDINDRSRTIETTIYYNERTGGMQDDAPPHHRCHRAHREWIARVGGTRGDGGKEGYHGLMDVDVACAASLLARWKAVVGDGKRAGVGFWDHRYFIYCDDADWSLRFAKAGWRVVLNLDSVVYHTPWHLKLTPARIYYANRNRLWMAQKVLPEGRLREVTRRVMKSFLNDSMHAAFHRRQFHARIILQTGLDAAANVGGKTGSDGPAAMPTLDALRETGCLEPGASVAVICNRPESLKWYAELLSELQTAAGSTPLPTFLPIVRNDVADPPAGAVIYGKRLRSRLKKQFWMLTHRPRAVVVFDQINDFPVLFGTPWTIHVDHKKLGSAQIERDGWLPRLGFVARWVVARFRLMRYARTVRPFVGEGRYG